MDSPEVPAFCEKKSLQVFLDALLEVESRSIDIIQFQEPLAAHIVSHPQSEPIVGI